MAQQHRVFIETYGCQMNVLDSELVADGLRAAGYELVDDERDADIVLLNTCSVRELAEHKVWSRLGRLGIIKREQNPNLHIGVLGCMAERDPQRIACRASHVGLICGPSSLHRLVALLHDVVGGASLQVAVGSDGCGAGRADPSDQLWQLDAGRSFDKRCAQAFVRITHGCNKFCSFCVVPYTRGAEVHRSPQEIVCEVQALVESGAKEVTLLGQTVNHYRYQVDGQTVGFAELLWRVHEAAPRLKRLRFVTSYPRDFDDETLAVMAESQRICRYLHLPVQSGSNRMLKSMNRGHTIEQYDALLCRARAKMPDLCIASDMIVGFPGETEADHRASVELMKRARFKSCFVFKYSPRPGTTAAKRLQDDVPDEVKKERNLELLDLQSQISLVHNQAQIGRVLEILVEGASKLRAHSEEAHSETSGTQRLVGRTRGDEIVAFDGGPELIGDIINVRAVDATPLTILAEGPERGDPVEKLQPAQLLVNNHTT